MTELTGLRAVVTGGAEGIGRATADALAEAGARVAVLDRSISEVKAPLLGFAADVSDRQGVNAAISAAADAMGGIDIVVNNAGIGAIGTVETQGDAEWARVLDVNVVGIARVSAAALPFLRRSASAAIVNVSSIAALNGLPERALYSASKGAVLALTFAMATDHVREGIRVNCVCPGTVRTAWVDRLLSAAEDPKAELAALESRQAIGRLVSPQEVARAILYLASPLSGSTTGTALDVDGGVTRVRVRPRP
jgi:NAD(P)-dependent dehydrogenase (short-subunit alcohol dehydrogenase family)